MKASIMLTFIMTRYSTVNVIRIRAELEKAARYRGIYTRVARQLGVSSHHVKEVVMGRRHSIRVMRAFKAEFSKIVDSERAA